MIDIFIASFISYNDKLCRTNFKTLFRHFKLFLFLFLLLRNTYFSNLIEIYIYIYIYNFFFQNANILVKQYCLNDL